MELEDLKRLWQDQDRKLDTCIRLNARLVRESALGKAETSLKRLSRMLLFEVLINLAAAVWLGSFLADHVAEARFLLPAAALGLGVIALLGSGIRQIVAIRTIDYGAPILAIQKRLESLRIERIRAVKWTLLLAPLAWTPLLIVALRAFLRLDAYSTLNTAWLAANLLFGLFVIPLVVGISRRYAGRMERSPLVQHLMRDIAGHSLTTATGFLASLEEFGREEIEEKESRA